MTNRSTTPGPLNCKNYDIPVFLQTQVMISAIMDINQRTPRLLPNLTLGYDIYDTCGDVNFAIMATLRLLKDQSDPHSCLPGNLSSTLPEPKTKAVIGERHSEVSVAVARVVALSSLPQISYASTSKLLSNKLKFPTFLRTISSDEYQTKAIAKFVVKMNWKTVAIVGSDDEYGMYGSDSLQQLFFNEEICVEFVTILSSDFSQNNSQTRTQLNKLVQSINESFAEAIILFSKEANADIILEAAIEKNLNRTWIASDAWATARKLAERKGIELAGQVFGFTYKMGEVPGFKEYVKSTFNGTNNTFIHNYLSCFDEPGENTDITKIDCSLTKSHRPCLHPSCLVNYIDQDHYNVYLAVQVIVEALRHLLKCNNQSCERSPNFTASEVNFTVNETHLFFDNNGDPSIGYDILYWNITGSKQGAQIITIGEYVLDRNVSISENNLTKHENVSIYNCSKTCSPGQELKSQVKKCCRKCVPCADGEFSPANGENCKICHKNQSSSAERDKCVDKPREFLDWQDPFSITLTSCGVLGIIVTIVFAILFSVYRSTPIVKAVGGYLCFLELFSLLICFCLTFSFMGKPTKTSCMVGLPVFGMAFSLCISCILANLLQILVGFSFDLKIRSWIKKLNQPVAVVTAVSGIQLALCVLWLYYYPPYPEEEESFSEETGSLHAYYPGDIIIGGLFPVHQMTNRSTTPGPLNCKNYDIPVFLQTQVMISAIMDINQRTPRLLPNLTLGYDIYDTCGDVNFAIMATLQLLKDQSDPHSCLPGNLSSSLPEPKTKAVIGERHSEVSVAVARVVALSSLPQISYASTSKLLSNKLKFPTFLRTISSDEYQTKAIAKFALNMKWKTVAIVGSDDEYGMYGSDSLQQLFFNEICVEFVTILSNDFSQNNSQTRTQLNELVQSINKSFAEAIILFSKEANADIILEAAIEKNLNRTWIASDAWATARKLAEMPGIELAGQVFGFTYKMGEVPGFKEYVKSTFNGTNNTFIHNYLSCFDEPGENTDITKIDCSLTKSHRPCLHPSCLVNYIDQDHYNVYLAVQVIVEALRHLLKCNNQSCERSPNFTASELLVEIQKVNFTVNETHLFFDNNGDPSIGYDILYWNITGSKQGAQIITIGEYGLDGNVSIFENLTKDENVSIYNCSKTCSKGQEFKLQDNKCCRKCVPCADGEFSPGNGENCKICFKNQSSSAERDECVDKPHEFLDWQDPFSITLTSCGVLGIIVTIVFAILFSVYRSTPIVKAVGGYLCFLELFSLLICFCLTFSFMGKPTKTSCMVGLPVFGMAFSLCISCILANLLQILVGFSFDLKIRSWIKKLNQPVAVVTAVSGIQLALCVLWLYYYPPYPEEEEVSITILLRCNKGSIAYFIAMICYNAFFALMCFLFAIKGKQLPDLYKNASRITISMLLFLTIWIIFIQAYINLVGKYKPAIESAAVLISSYSILGCHLAPKCYIMVFKKEINNEKIIAEYIRKHYEQKGMAVVKS
ncbi:hypothetical protein Q5P01_020607 [Channa striata]|uniref:G-protein coupled receptors family 3 profile domain-containing protein n=1 Tax=Channa striata TaxID=64152 RepID=A0AA88LXZ3_CHASR|nr:hypothetical protein Q5P01_020607 [Channa striata]